MTGDNTCADCGTEMRQIMYDHEGILWECLCGATWEDDPRGGSMAHADAIEEVE